MLARSNVPQPIKRGPRPERQMITGALPSVREMTRHPLHDPGHTGRA